MPMHYFTLPSVLRQFQAKRDAEAVRDECPKCGSGCNHTVQQKHLFALEALEEAAKYFNNA